MKHYLSSYAISLLLLVIFGCSKGPRPIDFGNDMCAFCKMSVVDRQHAAMAVTEKGKVYTFDAIECLIPFLGSHKTSWSDVLVSDYQNPGNLVPAENAHFLISKGIPSPMGAFATAFALREHAAAQRDTHGGEIFSWEGIKTKLTL